LTRYLPVLAAVWKALPRYLPFLVVALAAVWIASKARMPQPQPGEMNFEEFGKLPVVYQGRVKPFDTLARNSLVVVSDKQTYQDAQGQRRPAVHWLLDVITGAPAAADHKVFRIHNIELLEALGLEERQGSFRYALSEFQDKMPMIQDQAAQASDKPAGEREAYDRSVLTLANHYHFYENLRVAHNEQPIRSEHEVHALERILTTTFEGRLVLAVAPLGDNDSWIPYILASAQNQVQDRNDPSGKALQAIFTAYRAGDVVTFNRAVDEYQAAIKAADLDGAEKLSFEYFFNHFSPFYYAAVLYVFTFLIGVFSWVGWGKVLRNTALALIVFTFCIHTFGLVSRIYITGYPPVTNLYSSAIFIGWGCIILGVIIEWVSKIGVGNLVASVLGFCTLLIAHFLSLQEGETMEMMQAVLDTKFWLATHVTTITLGYTATYFAGFLALCYIIRRLVFGFKKQAFPTELMKTYARIIYGTLCFALLLSFVGTVLGGLWADDSWGRFWGWDPKENGALIIVLWNALILHARWGGMVKTRGLAVLAVFGNIVTSWSWFGVNQLSVGLHSYGFTDSVAFWLIVFVLSQLVFIGLGLLPVPVAQATVAPAKKPKPTAPPPAVPGKPATDVGTLG
jgi:ABC-type transport system involved in cytochrome c biogenesis permease subunit